MSDLELLTRTGPVPVLDAEDVARLLDDDTPDARVSVLARIATNYNDHQLQGREREVAEHIFRLLMKDVALRVRETLAHHLKATAHAPRDVMLHMAADVNSVATPVLQASPVLSESDLMGIVEKSHDLGKLMAITQRDTVSLRLSDALVGTSYAPVVTSLLSNEGARISEAALAVIVKEFHEDAQVTQALVRHHHLPLTMVEQLAGTASSAVAHELATTYQIDPQQLQQDTTQARDDFMLRLLEEEVPFDEVEALVIQMENEGRLNHSTVMTSLCRGQLAFFTVALARFAHVSIPNARRLVADRGGLGFEGLYAKSGMPASMGSALLLLLRAVQTLEGDHAIPGSMLYANRLAERVVAAAGKRKIEYLPYFLALIRRI